MSKTVIDLNKAVKEWAWKEYEATETAKQKRLRKKQENAKEKEKEKYVSIQIDWSSVSFVDKTEWIRDANVNLESATKQEGRQTETGRIDPVAEPTTSVLFETTFVNNTDVPQKYTMRTEKTTKSTINTSIERGVTKGVEMGVKLTTPYDVIEASAGFKREVTLTNSKGETFEEELTWGVESEIEVKENEAVEASLVINGKKWTGKFVVTTKISGEVRVTFTNVTDNNSFLKSSSVDIKDVVDQYKEGKELPFVTISGNVVLVETAGECKFCYGVSQQVKVNKRDLTPDEKAANVK